MSFGVIWMVCIVFTGFAVAIIIQVFSSSIGVTIIGLEHEPKINLNSSVINTVPLPKIP